MRTKRTLGAAGALVLLALAGCSQGSASDDTGSAEKPMPAAVAPQARDGVASLNGESDEAGRAGPSDTLKQVSAPTLASQDLIRTGIVRIVDKDLTKARDEIDSLLLKYGGSVGNEQTTNDKKGNPLTSTLVVRVPSSRFTEVMLAFRADKSVKSSSIATEEVHQQVIDVTSRLANLRVSLGRLREFLSKSTDINAMLDFEQRITNVESQIASLTAQRNYLADRTSMSTINIDLRTPDAPAPKPKKKDPLEGAGFLTGLGNGWHAMQDFLVVVATVVGAALPFGLAGALVGIPLWVLLRRRSRSSGAAGSVAGGNLRDNVAS